MNFHEASGLLRSVGSRIQWEAAFRDIKGRKLFRAIAHHRHTESLEYLEGTRKIENRFGAGANHGDRSSGQLCQIRGDIETQFGATMDATNSTGGKDADAGTSGDKDCPSNRRCSRLARGQHGAEVRAAYFSD